MGYNIDSIEHKVLGLFDVKKAELYSGSRKKPVSEVS
jgi:hypothetical protein